MCVLSVAIADVWEIKLVEEAVMEPVVKGIVPAVLVAGMAFHYGQEAFQSFMSGVVNEDEPKGVIIFITIFVLG